MLRNRHKYRVFSEALAATVRGKTVLDVGTGSGILALMAAAHGARRVVAVDRESVARMTRAVLSRYVKGTRIELWEHDIFDLNVAPVHFEVIVSETLGYLGFEENIVPILSYARRQFGNSRTIIMPADVSVTLHLTCLSAECSCQSPYLSRAPSAAESLDHVEATGAVRLGETTGSGIESINTWRARTPVTVDAIVAYFAARLFGTARVTNEQNPAWPHCIVELAEPVRLSEGETVTCRLRLDPSTRGSYQVAISMQDAKGTLLVERRFESTEIRNDLQLATCDTVDGVVQEVEDELRAINLFHLLT